jgi:hypothetical protein
MTFKFCELSAAIGYATCHYENYAECDLDEALAIALNEFIPPLDHLNIDHVTMAALVSHLDVATKEYQSDRDEEDQDEDEDEDELEDEDE